MLEPSSAPAVGERGEGGSVESGRAVGQVLIDQDQRVTLRLAAKN